MISITELFRKVVLDEAKKGSIEVHSHLPHIVERAIMGNPEESIRHAENGLNIVMNRPGEGSLSDKGDGKGSIVVAKGKVKYKGESGVWLSTAEEIKEHAEQTGKPHLIPILTAGLELAHHPEFSEDKMYQADVMINHSPSEVKGNIIRYKKKKRSHNTVLAVHTELDANTGKRIGDAPDLRHMETKTLGLPYLGLKGVRHFPKPSEITKIQSNINDARKIFSNPKVAKVVKEIGEHRDLTNQTGHRSIFLKGFNNAFQRGEYDHLGEKEKPFQRSFDILMHHAARKLGETTNSKEKGRIQGHIDYFTKNADAIDQMLQGHHHIDEARDAITTVLNRHERDLKPIDDKTGKVNLDLGEGWVSVIPGIEPVKFVSRAFTRKNAAESAAGKAKRKKNTIVENEGGAMLTASSGDISGMGYNLGGPAPDDVAVAPLKNRMASKEAKPFRRKLMTKLLGRLNVGREAY
jgi:hypothetical protein